MKRGSGDYDSDPERPRGDQEGGAGAGRCGAEIRKGQNGLRIAVGRHVQECGCPSATCWGRGRPSKKVHAGGARARDSLSVAPPHPPPWLG